MLRLVFPLLAASAASHAQGADCPQAGAAAQTLSSTAWLTTAVYEGDERTQNLIDQYPAVVGISLWDACSNRFEYFDPASGASRRATGGGGYFLFTGDGINQITLADNGPTLHRRLEVLDGTRFTYSRQVPKHFIEGKQAVTLHVVHTPYTGTLALPVRPDSGPR